MAQYFKGKVINTMKLPNLEYVLNIAVVKPSYKKTLYYVLDNTSHKACLNFRNYSNNDLKETIDTLNKIIYCNISSKEKEEFDNKMIDIFKGTSNAISGKEIIYEKVFDKDGNSYGKEIITGLLFPINCKYYSYDINYSFNELEPIVFDMEHKKAYRIDDRFEDTLFAINSNDRYEISHNDYISVKYLYKNDTVSLRVNDEYAEIASCPKPLSYKIILEPKMLFSKEKRVDYAIATEQIASELEVYNYVHQFDYGFGRKKHRKEYENIIRKLSLSNYLGEINIVPKNNYIKEKVSESNITSEMQELEFILHKLKNVSEKDYEEINKEYIELLNQNDAELHITSLSIRSIILLQNKAKLSFMCHGGEIQKIIDFLEKEANNYLENYKTGSNIKTELSISDLDKLCEYFLNSKNNYSVKEQNEILRLISLLYFFEIYENIDVLTIDDFKNSYASTNIKRIIVIIDILYEYGLIKSIPNSLYDVNNLEMFMDYIKKIEFTDKDSIVSKNGKDLIKKIQL